MPDIDLSQGIKLWSFPLIGSFLELQMFEAFPAGIRTFALEQLCCLWPAKLSVLARIPKPAIILFDQLPDARS